MSEELKPCPHCGGEARIIAKPYEPKVCVGCDDDTCLGFSGLGWLYDSDKEATEAWNRRAGSACEQRRTRRTCHVESSHVEQEIGAYSYLEVELSCGHAFTWDDGTPPDYCPFCGARIIREETDDAD